MILRVLRAIVCFLLHSGSSGTWVNYSDGTAGKTGSYNVSQAQRAAFHAKERLRGNR